MSRVLGFVALGLGAIGLVGCLAGLIGLWAVRPSFLRSSVEGLDTADEGLKLVEEKTTRADELLKAIRGIVAPVTGKILKLADKGERTPDDDKELKRISRLPEALSANRSATSTASWLSNTGIHSQTCRQHAQAKRRSFLWLAFPERRSLSSIGWGSVASSHSLSVIGYTPFVVPAPR